MIVSPTAFWQNTAPNRQIVPNPSRREEGGVKNWGIMEVEDGGGLIDDIAVIFTPIGFVLTVEVSPHAKKCRMISQTVR